MFLFPKRRHYPPNIRPPNFQAVQNKGYDDATNERLILLSSPLFPLLSECIPRPDPHIQSRLKLKPLLFTESFLLYMPTVVLKMNAGRFVFIATFGSGGEEECI
jgi:hypothetical protein